MANKKNTHKASTNLSQQSIDFLGLSKQPFGSEILSDKGFFKLKSLEKITDNLIHHVQFSDLILIVEGLQGSGKTSLFRHFIQSDINNTKSLPIQAEATDTLAQVQQKISLHLQDLGDANHLDENLKSLHMFDQQPLLIMDNSHVLSDTTLQELLRYQQEMKQAHEVSLKILLFANSGMAETIQNISDIQTDQLYIQNMPVYSPKQSESFLMHRLRNADYNGEPLLDDNDIQQLFKKCNGTPLSIMMLAAPVIDKVVAQKINPPIAGWKKALTAFSLITLIAAGLAIYIYLSEDHTQPDTSAVQELSIAPEEKQAVFIDEPESTDDAPIESIDTNADHSALITDNALSDTQATADDTPDIDTAAIVIEQDKVTTTVEENTQQSVISDNKTKNIDPITPSETAATLAEVQVEKVKKEVIKPLPVETKTVQKVDPVVSLHPSLKQLAQFGAHDAEWLKQQSANAWTMQLLGARDPETLLKFVKQHQLNNKVAWYKSWLKGKPYFVLVYGSYSNRDIARSSISKLPPQVQSLKPWVKSMKSVQQAIK